MRWEEDEEEVWRREMAELFIVIPLFCSSSLLHTIKRINEEKEEFGKMI